MKVNQAFPRKTPLFRLLVGLGACALLALPASAQRERSNPDPQRSEQARKQQQQGRPKQQARGKQQGKPVKTDREAAQPGVREKQAQQRPANPDRAQNARDQKAKASQQRIDNARRQKDLAELNKINRVNQAREKAEVKVQTDAAAQMKQAQRVEAARAKAAEKQAKDEEQQRIKAARQAAKANRTEKARTKQPKPALTPEQKAKRVEKSRARRLERIGSAERKLSEAEKATRIANARTTLSDLTPQVDGLAKRYLAAQETHNGRMARLQRIEDLLKRKGDEANLTRVKALRAKEMANNDKMRAALRKRLSEKQVQAVEDIGEVGTRRIQLNGRDANRARSAAKGNVRIKETR